MQPKFIHSKNREHFVNIYHIVSLETRQNRNVVYTEVNTADGRSTRFNATPEVIILSINTLCNSRMVFVCVEDGYDAPTGDAVNEAHPCPAEDRLKCTLSDTELVANVRQWNTELCETGGRAWSLRVPADVNSDPDLLIETLCKRFESLLTQTA